jgi:outer membrane protein assembly factor BamB
MFRGNPERTGFYNEIGVPSLHGEKWCFEMVSHEHLYCEISPCVVDGIVYVGDLYGNLYAVDTETGCEVWRFKTDKSIEMSSPCVAEGIVYIGGTDYNLYAVDADTGLEVWRFETGYR